MWRCPRQSLRPEGLQLLQVRTLHGLPSSLCKTHAKERIPCFVSFRDWGVDRGTKDGSHYCVVAVVVTLVLGRRFLLTLLFTYTRSLSGASVVSLLRPSKGLIVFYMLLCGQRRGGGDSLMRFTVCRCVYCEMWAECFSFNEYVVSAYSHGLLCKRRKTQCCCIHVFLSRAWQMDHLLFPFFGIVLRDYFC